MTIDRAEAQFELKESSQTYSDSLACELFSERSSMSFKSGASSREVNELDFSQDIYSRQGKENQASEGSRVTPLARAQREQRLADNQDVQQSAPGDRAAVVAEGKENEAVEAERATPLARAQREERLARNLDVQQSGRSSEHKENEIAQRSTPLASAQRAQRLMTDTLNQK